MSKSNQINDEFEGLKGDLFGNLFDQKRDVAFNERAEALAGGCPKPRICDSREDKEWTEQKKDSMTRLERMAYEARTFNPGTMPLTLTNEPKR